MGKADNILYRTQICKYHRLLSGYFRCYRTHSSDLNPRSIFATFEHKAAKERTTECFANKQYIGNKASLKVYNCGAKLLIKLAKKAARILCEKQDEAVAFAQF